MDENDDELEPLSQEVNDFLDQPVTRLELVQMVQPLRGVVIPLFQAAMNSLAILVSELEDGENKDKARKSFEELDKIFDFLDKFDDRIDNIFEAKPTWTSRKKDTDDE